MDQDPADPQSWNLYSYVRNNPLRFVDPTGKYVFDSSVRKRKSAFESNWGRARLRRTPYARSMARIRSSTRMLLGRPLLFTRSLCCAPTLPRRRELFKGISMLTSTELTGSVVVNVPVSPRAGFQVTLYGRLWVPPEAERPPAHLQAQSPCR